MRVGAHGEHHLLHTFRAKRFIGDGFEALISVLFGTDLCRAVELRRRDIAADGPGMKRARAEELSDRQRSKVFSGDRVMRATLFGVFDQPEQVARFAIGDVPEMALHMAKGGGDA